MMTLALIAGLLVLVGCLSGPIAAVAARNGRPVLAVIFGVLAVLSGYHLYAVVPTAVGLLGLLSAAAGVYAIVRAIRGTGK